MVALFKELGRPFPPILVVFSYPILPTFVNSRKMAIINTINYMKKEERETYLAPVTETIEVVFEGCIAASGLINDSGENDEVSW